MLNSSEFQRLQSIVHEIVDREGCTLYDIEFAGAGMGRVLRVYIDKPGVAVSIEDCTNVSRALNLRLDVEDIIPGGAYTLEVSSPGLERPLREPRHFQSVVGKRVWIKSKTSLVEGPSIRKQVVGALTAVTDAGITIEGEDGNLMIPYSNVEKAKLVFEFGQEIGADLRPGKSKKR